MVLGSGLTIVGAVYCPSFTRLPYFKSLAVPASIGISVALLAHTHPGAGHPDTRQLPRAFDPKRAMRTQGWRRIGTAVVRWPGPVLAGVDRRGAHPGLAALPGYKTSYDVRPYLPPGTPSNVGYAAAERHFSAARLNPELLMIESDRDLRNPAGMLMLEKVAKAVFAAPGWRWYGPSPGRWAPAAGPLVDPVPDVHAGRTQLEALPFQQARAQDLLTQVNEISNSIDLLKRQMALQQQPSDATNNQAEGISEHRRRHQGTARQDRQCRRLPEADPQLLLPGTALLTSRSATRSGRCSTRSTASTGSTTSSTRSGRPGSDDRAAAADPRTDPRAAGHPGTQ